VLGAVVLGLGVGGVHDFSCGLQWPLRPLSQVGAMGPDQSHTFSENLLKTFSPGHRPRSAPCEPIGELFSSLALEIFERVTAACHRHQQGLARAPHLGSAAV
jgi:hypothetical protein